MLETFTRRQKNKKQSKTDEVLTRGFALIEKKEYKQATIELTLALEEGAGELLPLLEQKFEEYVKANHNEAIRSIGLVLLKKRPNDHELLNLLGNTSRRLNEAKEANHFYRQALKVKGSYLKAFCNLAASLANVDKFDEAVQESLSRFEAGTDYFLPEYKNSIKLRNPDDFDQTCAELRKAIKENWKSQSIDEGRLTLQKDIFNLGLYALSKKKTELALENFEKLKKQQSRLEHLEMLIAISRELDGEDIQESINDLKRLLKEDPKNRYLNGNLGMLYKKAGNQLQSYKYFLICSSLLEQSEGFFSMRALVRFADEKMKEGDFKKALSLYKTASAELQDEMSWQKLGDLYYKIGENSDAIAAYKRVLEINPRSAVVRTRLKHIFTQLVEKAESLKNEKKFQQAVVIMERALKIERPPDLLEETAKTYKILRDFSTAERLLSECETTREKLKQKTLEKERQEFIVKGKEYSKRKDFTKAIEYLERASRIKLDKDVFLYLAHLYKGLKRTRSLQELMNRWHLTNDYDESRPST